VTRRFLHATLVALLAFQAVAMPAFAATIPAHLVTDAHDCAGGEGASSGNECPCCTDGTASTLGCATGCATAAALPALPQEVGRTEHVDVTGCARQPAASQSYLPLNPPPIR
jgi:hypothetical protein